VAASTIESAAGAQAKADAVQSNLTTHAALTAAGTHGSAVAATANKLMHRDAAGRSQVVDGAAAGDIATKGQVDAKVAWTDFLGLLSRFIMEY
jgi:hypothetical protein